jgi:hypothetical protein
MELKLTIIEEQNKTKLIYCFNKAIDLYYEKLDNLINDSEPIFMCSLGNQLESEFLQNIYKNFINNHRPYFNAWVTEKYTHDIINSNTYSVFLCVRIPFTTNSLNSVRINYLNHILETLKNSL